MWFDIKKLKYRGTQIAYAVVCIRKLWLFSKGISMERASDRVALGKLLDEESFEGERGFEDWNVSIDFITSKDGLVVHEIKLSRALEEAHIFQVKYYLYYLKARGVEVSRGVIHYPKARRILEVVLKEEDVERLEEIIDTVDKVLKLEEPPSPIRAPYCRSCAYRELCYG